MLLPGNVLVLTVVASRDEGTSSMFNRCQR